MRKLRYDRYGDELKYYIGFFSFFLFLRIQCFIVCIKIGSVIYGAIRKIGCFLEQGWSVENLVSFSFRKKIILFQRFVKFLVFRQIFLEFRSDFNFFSVSLNFSENFVQFYQISQRFLYFVKNGKFKRPPNSNPSEKKQTEPNQFELFFKLSSDEFISLLSI